MAAKASAQITLFYVVDVKATYRYYRLQSSTASTPSKPTVFPPNSWDDTEPSYVEGSTNSLFFVDCTIFNDNSFVYSEVSLSSSYEASKIAYNKAANAQSSVDNLEIGGSNLLNGTKDFSGFYSNRDTTKIFNGDEGFAYVDFPDVTTLDYRAISSTYSMLKKAAILDREVTFSFEAKSDAEISPSANNGLMVGFALCNDTTSDRLKYGTIYLYDRLISTNWSRYSVTQTLTENFFVNGNGAIADCTRFYIQIYNYSLNDVQIRKCKLEYGNKPTDWSPSAKDVETDVGSVKDNADALATRMEFAETAINTLTDQIRMSIRDANGETAMVYDSTTATWYYNIGTVNDKVNTMGQNVSDLSDSVNDIQSTISNVDESVKDLLSKVAYIRNGIDEDGSPYIELGKEDSDFKLRITNTAINLMSNNTSPVRIINNENNIGILNADNISVDDELEIGTTDGINTDGKFVWKKRSNGNLGLQWKG